MHLYNELHFQQAKKEEKWNIMKTQIDKKYQTEKQEYEENLRIALDQNMELIDEIQQKEQKLKELKQKEKSIQTFAYKNIQIELMHDFIVPKFALLDGYLKENAENIHEYFIDRMPKLTFAEENRMFKITLTGFFDHYTIFKAAFKRLINLFNSYNSGKEFYQRYLKRFIGSIKTNLFEVNVKTYCWKQYTKILIELLKEKNIEYVNRFNDSIREKAKSLIEQSMRGTSNPPWIELRLYTDEILEEKPFENEIHELKNRALEEFIKQNISFQRLKTDRIPTKKIYLYNRIFY